MLALSGCGGGSSGSSTTTAVQTEANLNGIWLGTYAHNATYLSGLELKLTNNGTSAISGTFLTDYNVSGTISGTVSGSNVTFTMSSTTPACTGNYSGSGVISGSNLAFTYSGTDCAGSYTNKTGNVSTVPDIASTVGASGNWYGITGIDYYTLLSLNSTDSANYTGTIKLINRVDSSVLTANVAGTASSLTLSGITGTLSSTTLTPTGGTITLSSASSSGVYVSWINFNYIYGGTGLSGATLSKLQ